MINNPAAFQKFQQAQGELSGALSRLLVVSENYPNLRANQGFRDLQAQLEGTENRIAVARNRHIKSVQDYNVTVCSFPGNLTAMAFGYKEKPNFAVENDKEISKTPKVDFGGGAGQAPRRGSGSRQVIGSRTARASFLAFTLCWSFLAGAEVAVPPLTGRVTDQTGTLTAAQKAAMEQTLTTFEDRKGSQLAVLIVPTTAPEAIEQYALRVAEQWKLGRKKVDDGAVLIVAKDDRALRIEVGYGLEGAE